jgi:hypothetical protein
MERIPGALSGVKEKVKAGEMVELVPFWALAVNASVLPHCMDALIEGFRVIFAGNGLVPAGLCPPQAGNNTKKKIVAKTPAH